MVFDRDPLDVLRELFAAHGVDGEVRDGWLHLPERVRARARIHEHPPRSGLHTVQLDVVVEPWTGCPVLESCAGFGGDREAAVASAWDAFATGSFHVLLVAFLHAECDHVRLAGWEIDGSLRAVTLGDITSRGEPPADRGWLDAFEAGIKDAGVPEGTHWIRLYYAHLDGESIACEVLLDNQPWTEVHAIMHRLAWPTGPRFYSVRLFLIVQGGVDVSRAVACLVDLADQDDDAIAAALVERGYAEDDAGLLVALIPLAFGRLLLRDVGATPSPLARVRRGGGEPHEFTLEDDPFFAEATWLAERASEGATLAPEQFTALARRSAEINALEQAMNAGSQPEDLELAPPLIALP